MNNRNQESKDWYKNYYSKYGSNRNDLRTNKEVLFQTLASEASFIKAVSNINHESIKVRVLDVGCGSGENFYQLHRVGYNFNNITGVDVNDERLNEGKINYPNCNFICCDASKMQFEDNTFDLVYESTLFATLPDDSLCKSIADEMIRVCKVGGYILLIDWRIPKPNNPNYNALTKRKLANFFKVGCQTKLITMEKGALIPPIGRFLSKYIPSIYFLVSSLFPFLVGQVAYLLKKEK